MAKTAAARATGTPATPDKPRIPIQPVSALVDRIVYGIREKKGTDIAVMHVGALKNVVTDYFILCTGSTDRQNQAIADSVEEEVRKALGEKPWHVEGTTTGEWILMDYVNVVVHIFVPRARDFYQLEELWADAPTERWAE